MAHNRTKGTKTQGDNHKAQTTNKEHSAQSSSGSQERSMDRDPGAGTSAKNLRGLRTDQKNFNFIVDGVPYFIKSTAFTYNDELRFRVVVNDDTEHVFTWDSEIKSLRAIDDDAATLPDGLEEAISEKLQNQAK